MIMICERRSIIMIPFKHHGTKLRFCGFVWQSQRIEREKKNVKWKRKKKKALAKENVEYV